MWGLLVAACAGGSDRGDDMLGALSGSPGPGVTTVEHGSSTTTEDSESTAMLEPSSSSGDDGLDTGLTGDTSTDTTSGTPLGGICAPIPSDAPCTACSKTSCCTQLEACSADDGCTCYMNCVAQTVDVFGCGLSCGVDLFAPGPVGDLVSCSAGPCASSCGV